MKILIIITSLILSAQAFAFPQAPFNALETSFKNTNPLMAQNYDFEGIIKLANCSGSIIRFAGQPETSNAYVLTNGHCLGRPFLKPGEAVANRPVNRNMKVFDKNMNLNMVTATKLVYGTMTGTDAAIYELKETYAQIQRNFNVEAFDFDAARPVIGLKIDIVSGYWERGYSCNIDGFVFELREAGWKFFDSIRYSSKGCNTIGGTSGSPIVAKGTRTVVGVNNTGNESGERCTMNNPCEVDNNGNIRSVKKASYGQQTYNFYNCLTVDFRIDTTLPACDLTKP